MFFKSKKDKAKEVAIHIEMIFRPFFYEIGRVGRDGEFNPPQGYYTNNYVIGFTTTTATLMHDHILKLSGASPANKAEFLLNVLGFLSIGDQEAELLKSYFLENWYALQNDSRYGEGADHAIMIFGLINGLTSPENSAPLIRMSLNEARERVSHGAGHNIKQEQILILTQKTIGAFIWSEYKH